MEKKMVVGFICLLLILVLSLSFVSASWFGNIWSKITGSVVEEDCSDGLDDDEDGSIDCDDSDCAYTVTCIPCTDSDGGKDYYTPGVATGIYAGGISSKHFIYGTPDYQYGVQVQVLDGPGESVYYDHCATDTQCNEGFCAVDGRLSSTSTNCPNGCEGGVCIEIGEVTACTGGEIPSNGCLCQGIEKTSGYCCYSYLMNQLMWTSVPCTQTCTSIGGVCCSGAGSDCDDWSNQWATDCQGYICCAGTCIGKIYHPETPTCLAQGGIICNSNQNCLGTRVGSDDSSRCCIGTCDPPSEDLTCSQQSKSICTTDQECMGSFVSSSDSDRCCDGYCLSPGSPVGYCGDGICNSTNNNETVSTCPADCSTTNETTVTDGTITTTQPTIPELDQVTNATSGLTPEQMASIEEQSTEVTEAIVSENGTASCLQGCLYEAACFPIGIRKKINGVNSYCNVGLSGGNVVYVWDPQREEDFFCENHHECRSNFCIDDKCVKQGIITRIINWFKRLFGIISSSEGGEGANQTTNQTTPINQTSGANQTT